jgi:plasmid stabilization system protein ParE
MSQAIWSPEATLDLEEVALYIAVHDSRPATADRIVHEVHELCNLIATQPEMGASHPEFGIGCRTCSYKKRWIVVYRSAADGIKVLRFLDGTRDYNRLL